MLVKASLLFQPAHLQVQGYELVTPTRDPYFVVAFSSLDFVPGLGRVFIGLVGSEHNLLSLPGDGVVGARAASDSDGLYQMIQYTKEAADGPDIDPERVSSEPRLYENATAQGRIQAVAETFQGFALSAAPRPMDVLFEVHHAARDVDLEALRVRTDGGGRVRLAVFGAPIWIREATDRTLLSSADVVEGVGAVHETWERFDEELRRSIRDEHHATTWKPEHATDFCLFGQWAVAWAKRVCPNPPTPLFYLPKRFRLFRWSWGDQVDDPAQTSIAGWYIGIPDWNGFFLSLDGGIYPASRWEVGATFLDETHPRPVAWDAPESAEATQEVLRMITYWLLPFARE